jgi:DNA invertase Pin-like site-specific DNA recombinase
VSGADPIDARPGFRDMLAYMLSNGARTIIVENASRFARDLIVQETGYAMLKARGIELVAADAPDSFLSDTPTAVLIRQILGAVHQFDKAMLVQKLRGARDRKSARLGRRIEGNPNWLPVPTGTIEAARAASNKGYRYGR